ncbi:helix-turn-helix transcriptional regulator [Paenibacillus hodogayensis]|uniref:Helix-turn-helix transcriptional regulator n=1 Tax=Paenibacillus hodogayensis TaxID=279208 RepID=A0ABV5W3Z6_9BACL
MSTSFHQIYNRYFDSLLLSRVPSDNAGERLEVPSSAGAGAVSRLVTPSGIEIVLSDHCFQAERLCRFRSDEAMVELSFCMQGGGEVDVSGETHELLPGNCSLHLMQGFEATFRYPSEQPIRTVAIGVPVALFEAYMSGGGAGPTRRASAGATFAGLLGERPFRMFRKSIDSRSSRLILQMLDCSYMSVMRHMYLEGKALELLAGSIETFLFGEGPSGSPASGLSRSDREKVREAEELLLGRMEAPPSLLELSRLVGLNDYKLKIGFKEQYGKSVFAYLRDRRLEKAWSLLQTGEISVSQASVMVGYANFSHFAETFRKQFGIRPSDIRRDNR